MPGICLIVYDRPIAEIGAQLDRMIARMANLPFHATRRWLSPGSDFAIAQVQLDAVPNSSPPTMDSSWVHGDQPGGFTAVRYDAERGQLLIENDRFGMMPLYYAKVDGALLAATELKAILAHPSFVTQVDPSGLADLLTFGFVLGEKTTVSGVRCLPGGTCLTYSAVDGQLSLERRWSIRERLGGPYVSDGRALPRMQASFRQAIDRCFESGHPSGLSLSGGLDSRTMLAAIDHRQHSVKTLTLDVQGGGDQVLAERIVRRTIGVENHCFLANDESFFSRWPDYLRETVFLSDGLFFDEACVMMRTVDIYRQQGVRLVLRGHGGELARMHEAYELRCNRHIRSCRERRSLIDQTFKQMSIGLDGGSIDRLLTPVWAERVRGSARASLEQAFGSIDASWHVADQMSCLYVEEYLRRQCVPSLAQLRSRVHVALPYLDAEYVDAVLSARPEMRLTTRAHRYILAQTNPSLLQIRNANTGASAGAAEWRQRISRTALVLLKRWFNYDQFPRYVDLPAWLAGPLRDHVNRVLLDSRTLDRGLFRPEAIRALSTGAKSEAFQPELTILVVCIELWHRLFVDAENSHPVLAA